MKNSNKNSKKSLNLKADSKENSKNDTVILSEAKNPKNSSKNSKNSAQNSANSNKNSNENSKNSKENSKNSQKRKTFWPYGILLSLFAIVAACVATIIFALDYPVYEDDAYLQKYQKVNNNYNELQLQDAAFKRNYRVRLNLEPKMDAKNRPFYEIKQGTKELEFMVQEISEDIHANGIKSTLLLTRPHTSEQDKLLDTSELVLNNEPYVIVTQKGVVTSTGLKKSFNRYTFVALLPESLSKGRWQIKLNAQKNENSIGFYEFNLLVSE